MTVTIILDGQSKELSEQDVKKMLIDRAIEVARNPRIRGYLSEVASALQFITNEMYIGRQLAMKQSGYVEPPFPEADALAEQLVDILQQYCKQQYKTSRIVWESGWETEVIPKIRAIQV